MSGSYAELVEMIKRGIRAEDAQFFPRIDFMRREPEPEPLVVEFDDVGTITSKTKRLT